MHGSTLAVTIALLAASGAVQAQPAQAPERHACFFISQFQNWRAPDSRTIYIRTDVSRYFRLRLAQACPALMWPESHLVMNIHGPDTICSAVDWDLKVNSDSHGIAEPCIVKAMKPMTQAEADAIPKQFKP